MDIIKEALKEAISIGDLIIDEACLEKDGISWMTIDLPSADKSEENWSAKFDLYNGSSGICLFLIELFVQTGEKKYLEAAELGTQWTLKACKIADSESYALFSGKMSVSFLLLRLYQVTRRQGYLNESLLITNDCLDFCSSELCELINGMGGTILGLIHVHDCTKDESILGLINAYIEKLFSHMRNSKTGIYWDKAPQNIHGLCGLSHGASGLAYIFTELGYYFGNPAFYELAQRAATYEDQYFSKDHFNWPDLRNDLPETKNQSLYETAYMGGNRTFFVKERFMNAWCHGAAGIGLARCRLYERIKDKKYLGDIDAAIRTTLYTDVYNFPGLSRTLCHGSPGNAELFLEAHNVLENNSYFESAKLIAEKIIAKKNETGNYITDAIYTDKNVSLFLGLSGIGYFFLRLNDPKSVPSVLLPKVNTSCTADTAYKWINIGLEEVRVRIIKVNFRRSFEIIIDVFPDEVRDHLKQWSTNTGLDSWRAFVKELLSKNVGHDDHTRICDIYYFEEFVTDFTHSIASDNLLFFKNKVKAEDSALLEKDDVSSLTLMTDSDYAVVKTSFDWSLFDQTPLHEFRNLPSGEFYHLLIPTFRGIVEMKISDFTFTLLDIFKTPTRGEDALAIIIEDSGIDDSPSINGFAKIMRGQIKEMLRAGLLLSPLKHPLNIRTTPILLNA